MGKVKNSVFISYRWADSAGYAGRIYDRLKDHFGVDAVFMDVDNIGAGLDLVKVLQNAVQCCVVLVVLIGRNWLNIKDENGKRRLDDPKDILRVEISNALHRDILVIPVLVDGALMPRSTELPKILKPLALRNALQVNHHSFDADVQRLIDRLESALKEEDQKHRKAEERASVAEEEQQHTVNKAVSPRNEVQREVEAQQNVANDAVLQEQEENKPSGLRVWWNKQTDGVKNAIILGIFTLITALSVVLLDTWIVNRPTPTPTLSCISADDILVKFVISRGKKELDTIGSLERITLESDTVYDFEVLITSIRDEPLPEFDYIWKNTGIDSGGELLHNTGRIVDYRSGQDIVEDAISLQLSQPTCSALAPYPFFILPNKE